MSQERYLGLQWKLAVIYLAVGFLSSIFVVAGYLLGTGTGLTPGAALCLGLGAGLTVGLAGSVVGFLQARSIKLRLWEAGDLAVRISHGDLNTRLAVAADDEIGLLEDQLNQMAVHLETAVGNLRQLAEQNRRLAEEAGRGASLEERARLARDLHDTVNQQLFVLSLRAAAARRRLELAAGTPEDLSQDLELLEDLSRQAHAQTRELILQLRPTTLEQQGLGAALHEYCKASGSREGWEIRLEIDTAIRLGGEIGENLFRVAQEALNNVSKHARATQVYVGLSADGETVTLVVKDNGFGFDSRACVRPTAVGLIGMQERLQALGGSLHVTSTPGQGTEVTAVIGLEGGDAS